MTRKIICLALMLILSRAAIADHKYYLSICAIFRDEAPYLKEWIEFHRLVGVEHFYLCSHNSTDNYREVLEPYISRGIVELTERASVDEGGMGGFILSEQCPFYNRIINQSRGESLWVAFLDSDEYLYPVETDTLRDFLVDYEEFGGIGVNWHMFGSSHVPKFDPKKTMIEQLVCCAPYHSSVNLHIKSVVQPSKCLHFSENPHSCIYMDGFASVNAEKIPFGGPFSPYVSSHLIRINHYWTRDEAYLREVKIPRRLSWNGSAETVIRENELYNSSSDDLSIQRFVPKLKKSLNLKKKKSKKRGSIPVVEVFTVDSFYMCSFNC